MIGWSKNRLGLPSAPLYYGLTWPVGIPTVFQTPVTVPLHCIRAVQWDCERVYSGQPREAVTQLTQQIPCRVFPWGVYPPSLIKPRKCQLTIIETILLARITKFSKAMKPKANFAHYITLVPLTDIMPSFSLRCLSTRSLIKQMLNIY